MRIAFVAQPFDSVRPPVRGGSVAMWIYYSAIICASRGHEVVVFGNHGQTLFTNTIRFDNVAYVFTPTGFDRLLNQISRAWTKPVSGSGVTNGRLPLFASGWHHLGYAAAVAWRARQMRCDVVHITNYSQFVPVVRKIYPRCKISLHMHCEWLTQLNFAVTEKRLKQTDLIIGCSEFITRKIADKFPGYERRCVTVPNATNEAFEGTMASSASNVVLFVGRLSPEKGIHDLIRAFHEVLRRFPDARLHLVGAPGSAPLEFLVGLSEEPQVKALKRFYPDGKSSKKDIYLEALKKEAGAELNRRIIFEGGVKHDQIQAWYARAAVLVNPSLSESFGISLIEAMMHKVPVVATRVGGMTYTVEHGRTGLLVEAAGPKGLAAAICQLLGDRALAARLGEAGKARAVEKFSWERTTDVLLDRFQELLN